MAKEDARKLAYIYFVEHLLTQKEAGEKAGVSKNTMTAWVSDGNWKQERDARIFSTNQRAENIKSVLGALAEETVELAKEMRGTKDRAEAKDIRISLASIADQAAKWNKSLDNIQNKEKISLSVYLSVMEDVFKRMYTQHPHLYNQLIEFQEELIHSKASEIA
jgi:transposase